MTAGQREGVESNDMVICDQHSDYITEMESKAMEYKDIDRVNSEIQMIDMRGKDYAMVPERVTAFRKLFPEGFITTEIVTMEGPVVLMKAKAGYYREDGSEVILATGMAREERGKGMVNSTSHIENAETSAVGRCLGFIGLGLNGGGICSAEELVNAITAQKQIEADFNKQKKEIEAKKLAELKKDPPADVIETDKLPW